MRLAAQKGNHRVLVATIAAALLAFLPTTGALATVDQSHDSVHHEVKTGHDSNICGNPGTFTFDVTSHTHTIDNGKNYVFDLHETYRYTLVFDDPALGTWTAHAAENIHLVANRRGDTFKSTFNSKEGPVQIIQHVTFRTDADGNVSADRTYERVVGC
jgi:hypothetical protein